MEIRQTFEVNYKHAGTRWQTGEHWLAYLTLIIHIYFEYAIE